MVSTAAYRNGPIARPSVSPAVQTPVYVPARSSPVAAVSAAATSGSMASGNIWHAAYPMPTTATLSAAAANPTRTVASVAAAPTRSRTEPHRYPARLPRASPTRCHSGVTSRAGATKHRNSTVEAAPPPSSTRAT